MNFPPRPVEIVGRPKCREAQGEGDYTVQNIKDCSAAIEMLPSLHEVYFKDLLHLSAERLRPAWCRGTFSRRPSPLRYSDRKCFFFLPAAFRAGDCLLLFRPIGGTDETFGYSPSWIWNYASKEWNKIWPQVKQAAKSVLRQCDLRNPEQNLGWISSKVPLGNDGFSEYRVGLTGVPKGFHPEYRFPEEDAYMVMLEPPFEVYHRLYQKGGIWDAHGDPAKHWDPTEHLWAYYDVVEM